MRAHILFIGRAVEIELNWGLRLGSIFNGFVILLSCVVQQVLLGDAFDDARFGCGFGLSLDATLLPEPEQSATVPALLVHVHKIC